MLLELALGLATIADVVHQAVDNRAAVTVDDRHRQLDREGAPVAATRVALGPDLEPARRRDAGPGPRQDPAELGDVGGRDDQVGHRPAQRFQRRPSEGPLGGAVPASDDPLRIGCDVGLVHQVEHDPAFRRLQRELALAADVLEHRDHPGDRAAAAQGRRPYRVDLPTVGVDVLEDLLLAGERRTVLVDQPGAPWRIGDELGDRPTDHPVDVPVAQALADRDPEPQVAVEAGQGRVRKLVEHLPVATLAGQAAAGQQDGDDGRHRGGGESDLDCMAGVHRGLTGSRERHRSRHPYRPRVRPA